MRQRLFTFIFGGEDSILQPHEKTLKAVWEAMLARAICTQHSFCRALAIMLSFSDVDFQKLVLNERSDLAEASTMSMRSGAETEDLETRTGANARSTKVSNERSDGRPHASTEFEVEPRIGNSGCSSVECNAPTARDDRV
eukprot:UN4821